MVDKRIKIQILRSDPSNDVDPFFQTYKVSLTEDMSVLDVLDYIHDNIDSSLAYFNHDACRRGVCSRCTIRLNSQPILACQAIAIDEMILTPIRTPVTRDLVLKPSSKEKSST